MFGQATHKRNVSGCSPDRIKLKKANFISTYIQTKKKSILANSNNDKYNIIPNKDNLQEKIMEKTNIFAKLKESNSLTSNNKLSKSRVKSSLWYILKLKQYVAKYKHNQL